MGVIVKLGQGLLKDPDRAYDFQSDCNSLASFGRTLVCADLMEVLEDWINGLRQEYELYDAGAESHSIAKTQGRVEALVQFKTFLGNLQFLDHTLDTQEES